MVVANDAAPDTSTVDQSGQSGRVRLADDVVPEISPEAVTSGWSPVGIIIAILLVALMVAALVIILWAVYQTTPA